MSKPVPSPLLSLATSWPVFRRIPVVSWDAAIAPGGPGRNELAAMQGAGGTQQFQAQLPSPNNYEQQLGAVKGMATQDPKRVAQVVKNWVATDG